MTITISLAIRDLLKKGKEEFFKWFLLPTTVFKELIILISIFLINHMDKN